jgi:hypothetical protein
MEAGQENGRNLEVTRLPMLITEGGRLLQQKLLERDMRDRRQD